jgi:hypothetical protein
MGCNGLVFGEAQPQPEPPRWPLSPALLPSFSSSSPPSATVTGTIPSSATIPELPPPITEPPSVASEAAGLDPTALIAALATVRSAAAEDVARQELATAQESAPAGAATSAEAPALPADALAALHTVAQAARDRAAAATAAAQEARDVAAALELQVAELNGVAPPPPPLGPPAAPLTPPLVTAVDLVEASTIASLHAHAAGVHNIRSLVLVTLDVHSTQYSCWCDFVMLTLQCFALNDHVTVDTAPSATPSWLRMDSVVLSWLLGSLSVDLQATVRERGGTAR